MKISIIGPFPKPYGGVSVHIQRLKARLNENNISAQVYDTSGTKKNETEVFEIKNMRLFLIKKLFQMNEKIIHFHIFNSKILIYSSLISIFGKKKIIITLHSFRQKIGISEKIAFWFASKSKVLFIAVASHIKEKLLDLGIVNTNIKVITAFIPPKIIENDISDIPNEIWDFIKKHKPIISANASRITFYEKTDLYGIDMCIELCSRLKEIYPKTGFVFCIPDISDYSYFNKLIMEIKDRKLENNFIFQTKQCQLYPIIKKSDLFVRPTNTDGYSVSLAEAIYFKIPVAASDVCQRPESTVLFKNRDNSDFFEKVKCILENHEYYKQLTENVKTEDFGEQLVDIYKKILGL